MAELSLRSPISTRRRDPVPLLVATADPRIRFYYYLSEEKVTEAVSQIPPDLLERLKVELKLPLVSVGNTRAGCSREATLSRQRRDEFRRPRRS